MPLTINVGLSRKASKDYQSSGVSINVTAELDQSLLGRPEQLQDEIDALYQQAEDAISRETDRLSPPADNTPSRRDRYAERNDRGPGGQHGRGNGRPHRNGGGTSPATESQRRAINSIATRLGIDPHVESKEIIGVELDQLTLREASELIDHLKSLSPAGNRNGGGR